MLHTLIPASQAYEPSTIEALNAQRIAFSDEYERLEAAQIEIRKLCSPGANILHLHIDLRLRAMGEDVDGIFECIARQQPKTVREIGIMLRALDHHVQMAVGAYGRPVDKEERQKRSDMVQSILSAVRATPPDHEEATPQEIHVAMSEATVELLSRAKSLAGKAFSSRLL
jgi:hypothetical protein